MDTSAHFDFYLIGPNFEHAIGTLGIKILQKIFVSPLNSDKNLSFEGLNIFLQLLELSFF